MHALTRFGTCAAVLTVVITSAAAVNSAQAAAEGGTRVVLDNVLRLCDFSRVTIAPMVPHPALATGMALIHTAGSNAIAEVHLYDEPEPGTHFDVGLIEMPRPASSTCGPADPGTAFTGLDTDAAGNATVTIQDTVRPGTTGVWVIVERRNAHSQNPAEYYTSEFVAPV
ncbi:MAG TPA: hypothetical protein VME67_07245 [Mycobacterium sp.]|nr:hypothetical protein [Mycobacterium sp.]HTX94643.1 hypothetical protein [Mycobacterium sp.]